MLTIFNTIHKGWEDETTSVNYYELFADTVSDLPNDVYYFSGDKGKYKIDHGSLAYIITTSEMYMLKSDGTWVLQS